MGHPLKPRRRGQGVANGSPDKNRGGPGRLADRPGRCHFRASHGGWQEVGPAPTRFRSRIGDTLLKVKSASGPSCREIEEGWVLRDSWDSDRHLAALRVPLASPSPHSSLNAPGARPSGPAHSLTVPHEAQVPRIHLAYSPAFSLCPNVNSVGKASPTTLSYTAAQPTPPLLGERCHVSMSSRT